jgi:hypothetical protein
MIRFSALLVIRILGARKFISSERRVWEEERYMKFFYFSILGLYRIDILALSLTRIVLLRHAEVGRKRESSSLFDNESHTIRGSEKKNCETGRKSTWMPKKRIGFGNRKFVLRRHSFHFLELMRIHPSMIGHPGQLYTIF